MPYSAIGSPCAALSPCICCLSCVRGSEFKKRHWSITGQAPMRQESATGWWDMPALSSSSRKFLLQIARDAIRSRVEMGDPLKVETDNPEFAVNRGCFVTLYLKGALRGCVGTFCRSQKLIEVG